MITGASSGIGEALAREYAGRGARVALMARRKERIERIARELAGARAIPCDVTDDASMEAAVAEAVRAFGGLDVVVANAGIGVTGPFESLTLEDYRRQFETNVFGVLRTLKATLEPLVRSSGRVGLIGSVSGFLSLPGTSPYAMSKFAVRALADALGAELATRGISVTHVAPGFIESEIRMLDNTGQLDASRDSIPPWLVMPREAAARRIADALEARKAEVVLTNHGKVAAFLSTRFPRTLQSLVRLGASQVMARTPK